MGGLMSWESAKRELKKLYKNPEKELLSINNDSSSYILGYSCKYMSKQQNKKHMPKTKKQFYNLVDRYNCSVDVCMFGNGEYDIVVDAPEGYGFCFGELPAIAINNSYSSVIRTAKQFWTFAYYELESQLEDYELMPDEYKRLYE